MATQEYFDSIAKGLRDLWPAGEKDGKYPWRDSVGNLSKRLKFLWENRDMKEYSIDACLTVGRKYLAQFETNAKYMKLLKYFIFKQNKLVGKDGKITYTYQSTFADMLENQSSLELEEDIEVLFDNQQGELI